jgi:multiple sugar transport system permease protein
MKQKPGLTEKQVAYLFVLPAILIILAVAVWPVLRSFWLSMYDVRLNDPAKNEIHFDYGLQMEKFTEVFPLLEGKVKQAKGEAGPNNEAILKQMESQLASLQTILSEVPEFTTQYDRVDELLLEGDPIPEELLYISLDKNKAEEVKQRMSELLRTSKKLAHNKEYKNLYGLANGLQKTLIQPNFIGFDHYKTFLTQDRFWSSLWNTTLFTVISVFIELVLGLAIALLINRQFRGRGLVRASVLVPWAIPTVVSALLWKFLFDGQNGIMAKFFELIGLIPNMGELLTTKTGSMFAVIFADVWKTTPFMTLLLLAGLQTIPSSLYEAARVDGASKVQQFFYITLPLLKSTIMVTLLFRTLDAFRVFDLIYVLTGGGPANATETISIYAYKTMFAQMNFGAGSALSVIVFICVAIISILYIRMLGADLMKDQRM